MQNLNDLMVQHIESWKSNKINKRIKRHLSDTAVITKIIESLSAKYRNFRQAWLSLAEDRQSIINLTVRLMNEEANLDLSE